MKKGGLYMPVTARRFRDADTYDVHNLIIRNFLEVNVKDYGLAAMQQLAATYTCLLYTSPSPRD